MKSISIKGPGGKIRRLRGQIENGVTFRVSMSQMCCQRKGEIPRRGYEDRKHTSEHSLA